MDNDEFRSYIPGIWSGDGLDDLYNVGGTGAANTLQVGLLNYLAAGQTSSAQFSCSATLDGSPYTLQGLVVADAEHSLASEYIQARASASGAGVGWRIIDRYKSPAACATNGTVTMTGSTQLRLNGSLTCPSGPMAVAFLQNATTADMVLQGGGRSAMALGVMVFTSDLSDAPLSYGQAQHLPNFTFSGGTPPPNATTNYGTMALATLAQPVIRLGASVDIENGSLASPTANGDDTNGTDDEDAFTAIPNIALRPNVTYTLSVPCLGTGAVVRGFIDFNRDAVFDTANERSAAATCNGTTAALSWTMPALAQLNPGPSFARFRIVSAANAAFIDLPASSAPDGEVEDYPVTLTAVPLTLRKQWTGAVVNDDATITASRASTVIDTLVSDAGAVGELDTDATPVNLFGGETITLAEVLPNTNAGLYNSALTCTGTSDTNPSDGLTVGATDTAIVCTYTNTRQTVDLSINKTNTLGVNNNLDQPSDPVTSGSSTTYTLIVANRGPDSVTGARIIDQPTSGLNCPATNLVTCSGQGCAGATPSSLTVGALTTTGITLGTLGLTAAGDTTLTFTCQVL